MKRGLAFVCWVIILSAQAANAVPVTINDTFIGGRPNFVADAGAVIPPNYLDTVRANYGSSDIIGHADSFDVTSMSVDLIGSNTLSVVIHSTFFDNIGELGIGLGDLFISTDGWNPVADTTQDYIGNGEDWEIAVSLDNYNALAGNLNAYNVVANNIVQSWVDPPAPGLARLYRGEQEVRYAANGEQSIGGGNWVVDTVANTLTLNVVFGQDFADIGGAVWGFHWVMTCGNDVIEGATSIPEPGTFALLLAGLGAAAARRRRRTA